jgi:hypothetical protein
MMPQLPAVTIQRRLNFTNTHVRAETGYIHPSVVKIARHSDRRNCDHSQSRIAALLLHKWRELTPQLISNPPRSAKLSWHQN